MDKTLLLSLSALLLIVSPAPALWKRQETVKAQVHEVLDIRHIPQIQAVLKTMNLQTLFAWKKLSQWAKWVFVREFYRSPEKLIIFLQQTALEDIETYTKHPEILMKLLGEIVEILERFEKEGKTFHPIDVVVQELQEREIVRVRPSVAEMNMFVFKKRSTYNEGQIEEFKKDTLEVLMWQIGQYSSVYQSILTHFQVTDARTFFEEKMKREVVIFWETKGDSAKIDIVNRVVGKLLAQVFGIEEKLKKFRGEVGGSEFDIDTLPEQLQKYDEKSFWVGFYIFWGRLEFEKTMAVDDLFHSYKRFAELLEDTDFLNAIRKKYAKID